MIVDRNGQPIESAPPISGALNHNYHYWTRYQPDIYYRTDSISLETYGLMYDTDETVFSGIEFLITSALSRFGDYTCEDARIEELVRRNLLAVPGSFTEKLAEMMTAYIYGFSFTEIVWQLGRGEVGLSDLQTLHPETISIDLHRDGPLKNRPKVAYQFFRSDKEVEIPLDKAILCKHCGHFGDAYGTSRLKRAYKNWFIKEAILKAWALCCQRYGKPYMVGKTNGRGSLQVGGRSVSAVDHLAEVMDSMGDQGSAVIGMDDAIEIIYARAGFGADFESLVGYCNKMIYRAIGLPSLIADHGTTGSYSLGQQHFEQFILTLEELMVELSETLIEQLVKPLVDYNAGLQDDYGHFQIEEFKVEDAKVLAETAEILARSGFVDPRNLADVNSVRERQGLPLWEEEDLAPFAPPEMPTIGEGETSEATDDENLEREESFSFSWAGRRRAARARRKAREQRISREAGRLAQHIG